MVQSSCRAFFATLVSVGGLTGTLSAQTTFDVGPMVGNYRPFGTFAPASIYLTSLPEKPSDLGGLAWGGTARIGFRPRFGAELQASATNSTIPAVITPGGMRGPTHAQVVVVTVQGQYDISLAAERYRVWVGAGPAFIRHGGDAYSPVGSPRSLGAALGVGVDTRIIRMLRMAAGVTAMAYTFNVTMPAEFKLNPGSLQHGNRVDALVYIGVRWSRP